MFKNKKLSYQVFNVFMVVALLLGFAVIPASAGGPAGGGVTVLVKAPTSVTVCTEFYVNVVVTNVSGTTYSNVNVKLEWDPVADAELLDPVDVNPFGTYTQTIRSLETAGLADVWWKFHCAASGTVTFTAEISKTGWTSVITDTFTVKQVPEPPEVLRIDIIQHPAGPVAVSENFAIKATVTNVSTEPVYTTTVSIALVDPPDPDVPEGEVNALSPVSVIVGPIRAGASKEVGFSYHCDGPRDAIFKVDAIYEGQTLPEQVTPASVTVVQVGTEISVALSTDWTKLCSECDEINNEMNTALVKATVTNDGDETATGVKVSLAITNTGGDGLVTPSTPQDLPNIPVGSSAAYTFTVSCTGPVDLELQATATADNAATVKSPGALDIEQRGDNELLVEIVEPVTGSWFSKGQEFPFKVRVTNCKDTGQTPVTVRITTTQDITLVVGTVIVEPRPAVPGWIVDPATNSVLLSNVCSCCWVDVTWTLKCDAPVIGTVFGVEVLVGSTIVNTDTVTINQETPAELMADYDVFPGWESEGKMNVMSVDAVAVGEKYTFVVPVANLGNAVAENVTLTVTVTGPTDCAGVLIHDFGKVISGTVEKYIKECVCTGEGPVEFYIEVSGTDENTDEAIPPALMHVPVCARVVRQYDVTVEYLEPLPGEEFTESDYFAVKVKITNDSTQDFGVGNTENVTVTLSWYDYTAGVEFMPTICAAYKSYTFTTDIGTDPSVLRAGTIHEYTWQMHCKHKGDVTFLLKLVSDNPRMKIEEYRTIHQNPPPPDWDNNEVFLCQQWNLISLPLIPEDPAIAKVLSRTNAEILKVTHYTGGPTGVGVWQNYSPDPLIPDDLSQMVDGKGYWVEVRDTPPTTPTLRVWGYDLCGPPPENLPPSYEVVAGWNLIGFKSRTQITATAYLAGVDEQLMVMYGFNACEGNVTEGWIRQQRYYPVQRGDLLDPGHGYWIALTAPGTIYP